MNGWTTSGCSEAERMLDEQDLRGARDGWLPAHTKTVLDPMNHIIEWTCRWGPQQRGVSQTFIPGTANTGGETSSQVLKRRASGGGSGNIAREHCEAGTTEGAEKQTVEDDEASATEATAVDEFGETSTKETSTLLSEEWPTVDGIETAGNSEGIQQIWSM